MSIDKAKSRFTRSSWW